MARQRPRRETAEEALVKATLRKKTTRRSTVRRPTRQLIRTAHAGSVGTTTKAEVMVVRCGNTSLKLVVFTKVLENSCYALSKTFLARCDLLYLQDYFLFFQGLHM